MALKPTIFKFKIALSDLNRDYYDTLNFTMAQHPSETTERMMVRAMAYCINAQEHLAFTKGLSSVEEPDLWARTLEGTTSLWIDVGEPNFDRVKKATRLAAEVKVYSFNTKSDVWWHQGQAKFSELKAAIYRMHWAGVQALAGLVQRTMDFSITISGDSAYIAADGGNCEVTWEQLQAI